ncbi:MAG: flagellar hook protein FlgE [Candidatus Velthaea sp.]
MAFDSLFVGVTGLNAYQQQIDVISNNIANVGTTGFKGQRVNFQDLLYQTQAFSSAPTQTRGGVNSQDLGLGVKVGTIDSNFTQGGLQTTGINTDLAINGDGFFVLNDLAGQGIPKFTRNGAFSINQNGVLYDPSSGLAVQGYAASKNGTITGTGAPGPLQIPLGLKSQAVSTGSGPKVGQTNDKVFDVAFGGNLDQTQYIQAVSNGGVGNALTTISTTIYDSLGGAHLVNITFQPAVSSGGGGATVLPAPIANAQGTSVVAATEWSYTISSTDGTTFNNGGTASASSKPQYLYFDQNGQFINSAGAGTANGTHRAGATPSAADGNQISVAQWGVLPNANNALNSPTPAPPPSGPIGLDFSNTSSLAGSPQPNVISQNGFAQGVLSNITIGQDGSVNGAFTNGQTAVLGRVALATFQNEQGLSRVGGSAFEASANSGLAQYGAGAQGRFGSVISGSLEQSNVSIADEFTKMIVAQRSFEANSRSISTADQDLQTVIALKR